MDRRSSRRLFLRMLAASPLFPYLALPSTIAKALAQEQFREGPIGSSLITSAAEALTVFDLEAVAKEKLHYGHVAWLAGTEDEATYRANRSGFSEYQLRVRRLVDVNKIDMSMSMFDTTWPAPILLSPCGVLGAVHPDAEVEVARATASTGHLQVLSTEASKPIEDVVAARGAAVWFQLYRNRDWNKTLSMIKRAERVGSPALVWTIDGQTGDKRTILARARRRDPAFCGSCHRLNPDDVGLTLPGFLGSRPMSRTTPVGPPMLEDEIATWDYVRRLKDATTMKVLLKGIVTREDAELAAEYGVDGIWISNHGGRKENSGRSTIECVAEIAAAVGRRLPIIVDGGFRTGTDIFKALALGATCVGVGRPYVYGLAAFGHEGVAAALNVLNSELRLVMRQAGTPALGKITKAHITGRRGRE